MTPLDTDILERLRLHSLHTSRVSLHTRPTETTSSLTDLFTRLSSVSGVKEYYKSMPACLPYWLLQCQSLKSVAPSFPPHYTVAPLPAELKLYGPLAKAAYHLDGPLLTFLSECSASRPLSQPFTKADVVLLKNTASLNPSLPLHPVHAILLDRPQKTILVCIRGTAFWKEGLADLCGEPSPLLGFGFNASAHQGMLAMAEVLSSDEFMPHEERKWKRGGGKRGGVGGPSVFVNREAWKRCMADKVEVASDGSSGELFEVPLFYEETNPFPPKVTGILAVLQRLVDYSCLGLFDRGVGGGGGEGGGYKGFRIMCVGHSLGGGVCSILSLMISQRLTFPGIISPKVEDLPPAQQLAMAQQECALIPPHPVYCFSLGAPASLSPSLSSLGSLSVGDIERYWGGGVGGSSSTRPAGALPQWWPSSPSCPWSPDLPIMSSVVMDKDVVPSLTTTNVISFVKLASSPDNLAKTRAFVIATVGDVTTERVIKPLITVGNLLTGAVGGVTSVVHAVGAAGGSIAKRWSPWGGVKPPPSGGSGGGGGGGGDNSVPSISTSASAAAAAAMPSPPSSSPRDVNDVVVDGLTVKTDGFAVEKGVGDRYEDEGGEEEEEEEEVGGVGGTTSTLHSAPASAQLPPPTPIHLPHWDVTRFASSSNTFTEYLKQWRVFHLRGLVEQLLVPPGVIFHATRAAPGVYDDLWGMSVVPAHTFSCISPHPLAKKDHSPSLLGAVIKLIEAKITGGKIPK